MNEMKQWAFGITISAIVGAVILFFSPEGATEKLVRAAVSLFLMCAILSPFLSNADPTKIFDGLELPEIEVAPSTSDEAAEHLQNEIKEKISDILEECGIKNADIRISINIENGNEMKIEGVQIFAEKNYENQFEIAEKNLKNQLGIETKIEVKK